jgi:uncharacterized protein (DUF2225 family)
MVKTWAFVLVSSYSKTSKNDENFKKGRLVEVSIYRQKLQKMMKTSKKGYDQLRQTIFEKWQKLRKMMKTSK